MSQFTRILAWISQGVNCILLGGHQDMTVSARAYLNRDSTAWGYAYHAINTVAFWQDDHCRTSFDADVEFARDVLAAQAKDSAK